MGDQVQDGIIDGCLCRDGIFRAMCPLGLCGVGHGLFGDEGCREMLKRLSVNPVMPPSGMIVGCGREMWVSQILGMDGVVMTPS